MIDVLRASAEKSENGFRVYLFEQDEHEKKYGSDNIWSVLDIAEHENLLTIIEFLDRKHDFSDKKVVVQDNKGDWVEPDCVSIAEALECTVS